MAAGGRIKLASLILGVDLVPILAAQPHNFVKLGICGEHAEGLS